jgi:hypothetical protein
MDRNIRYVRDKGVPNLLNDMVLHLLEKTPSDPITALIVFLEERQPATRAAGGPAPTEQPAKVAGAAAAEPQPSSSEAAAVDPKRASGVETAASDHTAAKRKEPPAEVLSAVEPTAANSDVQSILEKIATAEEAFHQLLVAAQQDLPANSPLFMALGLAVMGSKEIAVRSKGQPFAAEGSGAAEYLHLQSSVDTAQSLSHEVSAALVATSSSDLAGVAAAPLFAEYVKSLQQSEALCDEILSLETKIQVALLAASQQECCA